MNPFDGKSTIKQVGPKEWGAIIDYDAPMWDHPHKGMIPKPPPPAPDWVYILHYGGGPTEAGEDNPHTELTKGERVLLFMGQVQRVIRGYSSFHIYGRGWRGFAYNGAIPKWVTRLFRARGFSHNGAQMGTTWNAHSVALVYPIGGDQKPGRKGRMVFARLWLEYPPPGRREIAGVGMRGVLGHRHSSGSTHCPGNRLAEWILNEGWIADLGTMKRTKRGWATKGGKVKSLTKRLSDLGYYNGIERTYTVGVEAAVVRFQTEHGLTVDGRVGPQTLRALAAA